MEGGRGRERERDRERGGEREGEGEREGGRGRERERREVGVEGCKFLLPKEMTFTFYICKKCLLDLQWDTFANTR